MIHVVTNIGIINIGKVPREVLKAKDEAWGFQHRPRDLVNICEWQNHVWSLLLHKSEENAVKMEKIIAHLHCLLNSQVLFINAQFGPWTGSHD